MKKAKAQHVAKPAKAAKPPAPHAQQVLGTVQRSTLKAPSAKHPQHHASAKHTHGGKGAASKKHAVKRGWSPDSDVAICSARAVAESLRLTLGVPVSHDDVLALYWRVADDADAGAAILDVLTAAQEHGLGGCFPVNWRPSVFGDRSVILGARLPNGEGHSMVTCEHIFWSWGEPHRPADFADCVVEEAWAVQWQ